MKFLAAATVMLVLVSTGGFFAHSAEPNRIVNVGSKEKKGGWLGVSIQDMTPKLARSMDVKTSEGALVNEVVDDSPAEKAGIKDEDIIVEFNGKKIVVADDLSDAVRTTKTGSTASIIVSRKNERKTLEATIGETPKRQIAVANAPRVHDIMTWNSSGMFGLQLRELPEQLGAYFGAPNNRGVLVEEVEENSKGAKAGFKAGDVITKVGRKTVEDIEDIRRGLYAYDDGEKVDIEVLRKGAKQMMNVEVEEIDEPNSLHFFYDKPHGFRWNGFEIPDVPELNVIPDIDRQIRLELLQPRMKSIKKDVQRWKRDLNKEIRAIVEQEIENARRLREVHKPCVESQSYPTL